MPKERRKIMNSITIDKNLASSLWNYYIDHGIITAEGNIYLNPLDKKQVLKIFHRQNGLYFSNKLYTINSLLDIKETIDIDEIIFPDQLLILDDKVVGYSMPFINGPTLDKVLNQPEIDITTKINYLKQIGTILRKLEEIQKENPSLNLHLNDLHDKNLIINPEQKTLQVIDIDSCRIYENHPFVSKYLSNISALNEFPKKYNNKIKLSCGGRFIPDANTDIYCYIIIILNFLYQGNIQNLTIDEYFNYLTYLKDINATQELIDNLALIYSDKDNQNIDYLLDTIPTFYSKANKRCYSPK